MIGESQETNEGHAGRDRGKEGQNEKMWVREKSEKVLITAMHLSEWHLELTGTTCGQTTSRTELWLAGQIHTKPDLVPSIHNPLTHDPRPQETVQEKETEALHLTSSLLLQVDTFTVIVYYYYYYGASHLQIVNV